MESGDTAGGLAAQAEFTVLRRPSEDNKCWYTAVHQGEPVTFRVLDDGSMDPLDGTDHIKSRVQAMHKYAEEASIGLASELAYRAVLVEVSLLDDPMSVPEETRRDLDCAIDLWCPLHVALMTASKSEAKDLLEFHAVHAVAAMTLIANTQSTIGGGITATDGLGSPPAVQAHTNGALDTPANNDVVLHPPVSAVPILECQVRRELSGAVTLLGHFDGRIRPPSSSVIHKGCCPPSSARGASEQASSVGGCPGDIESAIAGGSHCSSGAVVSEEALVENLCRYNDALLKEEDSLFEDKGEEYCLSNVLVAMRPLLQSIVFEIKRRGQCPTPVVPESAMEFVRDYCVGLSALPQHHPSLVVDGDVVFELCNQGDIALLSKVMDAFGGHLAPILRGQTLITDRSSGASSAKGAQLNAGAGSVPPHVSSLNPSPLLSSAVPSGSPGSLALGGDASAQSMAGALHKCSSGRHSHALPPEPFWWSCSPQQVHRLAFVATWIGYREVAEESSCPGCRRRAVDIANESRVTMATIRQLQESRVAAQKLDSTIWSGHLITITKLLSRGCTLEDYIDFVEKGGYFTFTVTRGFSGLFLSVLVSGVMAAALVQEPTTLQLLECKVKAVLCDVTSRSSPLRAYVLGRPSTHAERFRELWLDAGRHHGAVNPSGGTGQGDCYAPGAEGSDAAGNICRGERRPMKFRSRVELLYYAVIEQVVAAAEEAWTMRWAERGQSTMVARGNAAPSSSLQPSSATKAEALVALQNWLLIWTNFFSGLCDCTSHQGRLLDHASTSSQALQQDRSQLTLSSTAEASPAVGGTSPPTVATSTLEHAHAANTEDVFSEDADETIDTVQRVCTALRERLKTGQEPLPVLCSALFPNGDKNMGTGAPGAGTSTQVGPTLPVFSIDQEFASAQHGFAAIASKESNEVKLKFYALFKQATIGDVNTDRPGMFDYAGRAKWDAWSKLKGLSLLDAKRTYVSEYNMMMALRKPQK
ncbi:hypothetical protein JKF63_06950 [Porcisia hertigi]|uniref:ACB domain-containing protein n=1 Tax=Porcisia hertigi TaxID=2761500 RepID=A0A836LJE8_9TRYP|nr:hypothetical protein JKF63_06950 [Porcisia hertigi]